MTPDFTYPTFSEPQTHLSDRTINVWAGDVVGGSSAVNAMMTVRGAKEDYDRWDKLFGVNANVGWNWDSLLPYFKKALNFVPPDPGVAATANISYDASYWGNSSGVYASWPSFQYPGSKATFDAFRDIPGVDFPPDSGAGLPGVYWFPQFMDPKNATRSYSRTGHFDQIKRSNYQLITSSNVLTILLDGTTATGVTFAPTNSNTSSPVTTVRANKEVILAAGGIHSPQILQRSGIGPSKLLKSANITTIVDLPGVGQNFQDHSILTMVLNRESSPLLDMYMVSTNRCVVQVRNFTISPSPTDLMSNTSFQSWADSVWAANRTGPYSIALVNAAAWLPYPVISSRWQSIADKLADQDPASSLPADTDPTVVAGYTAQLRLMEQALQSNGTAFYNLYLQGGPSGGILLDLHPLSRGSVTIDPSDPFGKEPLVDYRALSNPIDSLVMADIVRFTRSFYFGVEANRRLGPEEISPGVEVEDDASLAGWLAEAVIPSEAHPSGTCSMMPRDIGGVVDQQLKVYGTQNLRVVDASIMPMLPGGNTCQPVYAIAEKVSRYCPAKVYLLISCFRPRI
jgi:choline dehydrogenase-like flavoprotein